MHHPVVVPSEFKAETVASGPLASAVSRTWSVKRQDSAVRVAHEAVKHPVHIDIISGDGPRRVDVAGERALAGPAAAAWNIESSELSLRRAQITKFPQ